MKKLIAITMAVVLLLTMAVTAPVAAKPTVWHVPEDFATIQEAINSDDVLAGDTIIVGAGEWDGAIVDKAVEIRGEGGAVIVDGPAHPRYTHLHYGFKLGYDLGGSGATISHFTFRGGEIGDTSQYLAFPIFAFKADNVTIEHNVLNDSLQGISNWEGSGWNISHNVINGLRTECGGGIGIFIGCYSGDTATANNNLVAHNKIMGQIVVPEDDCGGYSGPGICLMSDRRFSGGTLSGNRILHNKVALSSTDPELVEAVGIELTDMGLEQTLEQETPAPDLTDNKVGFNDVRGVEDYPIALNPDEVADYNNISRNLGDTTNNRGHGLHPQELFR